MLGRKHLLAAGSIIFIILVTAYPTQSLAGARKGISDFFEFVLPALLPFFVGTSILIKSGALSTLSARLNRIFMALFNLPGESAVVFIMSCISGYPNGARMAAELYSQRELTKPQAARTIILASTSGPSFIVGAVAAGLLLSPSSAVMLSICHYLSAIITGLLARAIIKDTAHETNTKKLPPKKPQEQSASRVLVSSIKSSMVDLLSVGAFVIFFASLISILEFTGVVDIIAQVFSDPLQLIGIPPQLSKGIVAGMVEMTNGAVSITSTLAPFSYKLVCLCAIISFGGFSIIFQIYSYAAQCKVKMSVLVLMKLFQAVTSVFVSTLYIHLFPTDIAVFAPTNSGFAYVFANSTILFVTGALFLFALGAAMALYSLKFENRYKKRRSNPGK